jgi:hypothetical protein
VNTASPSQALEVTGAIKNSSFIWTTNGQFLDTAGNAILTMGSAQTAAWSLAPTSTNGMAFSGSTLTNGNLVSIAASGTAASTGKTGLNIVTSGANASGGQTTYGAQISNTSTGTSVNIGASLSASGGSTNTALQVTAGNATFAGTIANAGIGSDATHTDSTVCQDTTSHIFFSGSGAAGICLGTSSARFKRDIKAMGMGLKQISSLRPVSFNYLKGYGDDGARRQVGFVAEDVYKIVPSLVGLDSAGKPQSVDYMGVMVVAVNAIKELNEKVDAQQREIDRLRHQLRHRR